MLRKSLALMLLVVALGFAPQAVANPFNDGVAAYDRGDYVTALRLWRPLADQGNVHAQFNLGVKYHQGQGVPQDYAQAVSWCRKAADQGMVTAQFNLGVMYEHGLGIPRDYVQAHMWLNLAGAREADPERRSRMVKRRDELAAGMTREQIARAQRLAWEWKPKGR